MLVRTILQNFTAKLADCMIFFVVCDVCINIIKKKKKSRKNATLELVHTLHLLLWLDNILSKQSRKYTMTVRHKVNCKKMILVCNLVSWFFLIQLTCFYFTWFGPHDFTIFFSYIYLQFQDEVEKCKTTYEALNSQLIEELPTLIDAAMSIFMNVISEFVLGRKVLVGRITKELLSLMDVSNFVIFMVNTQFDQRGSYTKLLRWR